MASKTKFEMLDQGGFDSELDMPDFDFEPPKESKKNARTVALSLSKAAMKGGVQGLVEDGFIRRTIRTALPRGYGTALDIADESSSTLRSLYNDSSKEIKPLLNDLKRVTKRIQEPLDKYLPRALSKRLNSWASSADSGMQGLDPEQQREASLMSNINEVFKHQVTSQAKRDQAEDARSRIREGIDQTRHKDSLGQLNQIRLSVSQLASYQNSVTANYQRKSLELQYRSYFMMRDMFQEQKRMSSVTEEAYSKIIRNTGLPEYVKLSESERLKQIVRNRFADLAEQTLLGDRGDFIRKTGANIRKVVGSRIQNFATNASYGLQSAESAGELLSMQKEMAGFGMDGGTPGELVANSVGGMMAQHYGDKAAQALRKRMPTTGRAGKVVNAGRKLGNQISYHARNLPQTASKWAQSTEGIPYVPNIISEILRDAINMNAGPERTLQKDKLADMQGPAIFTNQTRKSITEVIPGYLARIYREIQVLRTGDEKTELLGYDYMTNKFNKHSDMRKGVYNKLVNKTQAGYLKEDMDKMLKHIDPNGDKLKPEHRKALAHQMLMDNLHGVGGLVTHYQEPTNFNAIAGHHAEHLSKVFSERYGKKADPNFALRDQYSALQSNLGSNIRLQRSTIQDMANSGMLDILESLGLVDKFGNIELEKIYEHHLNPGYKAGTGDGSKVGLRKASRQRNAGLGRGLGGGRGPGIRHASSTVIHNHPETKLEQGYHPQAPISAEGFKEVVEAIKQNNNLTILEKVNATLIRIEQEIQNGLVTYTAGGVEANHVDENGKPFLDKTLRQHWRTGMAGARSGAGKAWDWWKKPGYGTKLWQNKGNIFQSAKTSMRNLWGAAKEKIDEMTEVYIKGELKPRLTAWGMKAGMYYGEISEDGKRKVIKSWKDIKGAVYDENGKIIMTAEEAMNAFARTTVGMKAIEVGQWVKEKAQQAFKGAQVLSGGIYGAAFQAAKKGMTYLNAQDVFVKDDLKNPILQATIMRAKGYRSEARPDKYILKPDDIDGPVVNLKGEVVLTENQIKTGLCDRHGRPLVSNGLRLLQIGHDAIGTALNKVKNGFNMAKSMLSGKFQGFANWFKVDGIAFSGGKTIIERLTEIRDLLDQRLPKRKKHVIGDVDGNGIREGSYEDQVKKGEIKDDTGSIADLAKAAGGKVAKGGRGLFGLLGAGGSGLMNLLNHFRKNKGAKGDGKESTLDKAEGIADIAGDALPFAGKLGRWGAKGVRGLARGVGGVGKYGLDAAKALRAGEKVKGPLEALKAARAAKAAATAAKAAEGLSGAAEAAAGVGGKSLLRSGAGLAGKGLMGAAKLGLKVGGTVASTLGRSFFMGLPEVAGAIGEGALAVGSGLLGLISLPVILGAAAVAGAAYGGYKLYQHFSQKSLTPLSTMRYVQYGFKPDDKDHYAAVFQLEDLLEKHVSYKNGIPTLDNKGLKEEQLLDPFGVKKGNKVQVQNWLKWFTLRFKPVFLTNMASLHRIDSSQTGLGKVEKLKAIDKKKFFSEAKWPGGPYRYFTSPFVGMDSLTQGDKEVAAYEATVEKQLDLEVKKAPASDKSTSSNLPETKTIAQVTAAATVAQAIGMKSGGGAAWQPIAKMADGKTGTNVAASGAMITMAGNFDASHMLTGSKLDALSCIRFKAYGLEEMNIEKVKTLLQLENYIQKNVKINDKHVAIWSGDLKKMFSEEAPAFGVQSINTTEGYNFIAWFNLRFLPTYLAYVSALVSATNKDDPRAAMLMLKPQAALDVAAAIKTAHGKNGSVWKITQMPWKNYKANTDVNSTDTNYHGLQDQAQRTKLEETTSLKDKTKTDAAKKKGDKDGANGSPASGGGNMFSNAWKSLTTDSAGKTNTFGSIVNAIGSGVSKAASAVGGVVSAGASAIASSAGYGAPSGAAAAGGPTGESGGKVVGQAGEGTGGAAAKLPDPKSNGTWAGLKDLILGAAKMVGVDGHLMATMAAIESGFNYMVKAGTSAAKGLYQFIPSTWRNMIKKYGAKFGLGPATQPTDPKANALMGAEYVKENSAILSRALKRPLTETDVYIAHFLGPGGAIQLLKGDPNQIAANSMQAAANANRPIFFDKGRPRTFGEVIGYLDHLVKTKGAKFGIAATGGSTVPPTTAGSIQSAGGEALTGSDKGQATPAQAGAAAATGAGAKAPGAAAAMAGMAAGGSSLPGAMPGVTPPAPPGAGTSSPNAPGGADSAGPHKAAPGSNGMPMGGRTIPVAAAGGAAAARTVFDSMGGAGRPAGSAMPANHMQDRQSRGARNSATQDPFAMPNVGAGAAMGTGFSPQAARQATDMLATRRQQAAASASTALPAADVASQSLDVLKAQLAALNLLVKYAAAGVGAQGAAGGANAATAPSSMASTVANAKAAARNPQQMKQNLVSVAKPSFLEA